MYFRYNISGKAKVTYEKSSNYGRDMKEIETEEGDLFDGDRKFNRFLVGWHIGADVMFNRKFYAGVSYSSDITKLYDDDFDDQSYIHHEKVDSHAINISLGYVF